MKLYFLTRDSGPGEDYPRIGWISPLPAGADKLWGRYGNLRASEFPEIVLSGHQGTWRLFLSAINSGRMDSHVGRGRIIRMTLYITGRVDEGEKVVGLIDQFLRETLSRTSSSSLLQDLFSSEIHHGDPVKWRDLPAAEQNEISNRILSRLTDLSRRTQSQSISEGAWMGGCMAENLEKFAAHCHAILTGKDGTALSLANLSSSEIDRVLGKEGDSGGIAVLLTTEEEKDSPWRPIPMGLSAPSKPMNESFCPPNVPDTLREKLGDIIDCAENCLKKKRLKTVLVVVTPIILAMIVWWWLKEPAKPAAISRGGTSQSVDVSSGK